MPPRTMSPPTSSTPFFAADSELADLECHVRRLKASVHSPSVTHAEHILVDIQRATLEKHEAQLQVRIASSAAGFDEHRQLWQGKLDDLDRRIAELTAVLDEAVLGLQLATFQRFAAAMVIGIVALRRLFNPPADGRPPLISQRYLADTGFVSDEPTAR